MFEAEIMITGYTIVVVTCTMGISKLLCGKKTKLIQREISYLKTSLLLLENENKKLKSKSSPLT